MNETENLIQKMIIEGKVAQRRVRTVTTIIVVVVLSLFITLACNAYAAPANVQQTIVQTAVKHGLDPAVALAIAEVESTFNPNATGKAGEIGIMQLLPKFNPTASYNVKINVEIGVKNLLFWQRRCPNKKELTFVNCYNRGYRSVVNPKTTPYYRKFIKAYRKHSKSTDFPPLLASVE